MPLDMVYSLMSHGPQMVYTATGTTSATGALTFTLPAGMFTSVLSVQANAIRDTVSPGVACFALVRTFSPTSVAVQVFESRTIVLGGGEGLEATTTATVVHLAVFGT